MSETVQNETAPASVPTAEQPAAPQPAVVAKSEQGGVALIKSQYIDKDYKKELDVQYLPKDVADDLVQKEEGNKRAAEDSSEGPKQKKFKAKGRFKNRPRDKRPDQNEKICTAIVQGRECAYGDKCRFLHDLKKYGTSRTPDIGEKCYVFETYGYCPYGVTCMYSSKHLTADYDNIKNMDKYEEGVFANSNVLNTVKRDLQIKLRRKDYDFKAAHDIVEKVKKMNFGESAKAAEVENNSNGSVEKNGSLHDTNGENRENGSSTTNPETPMVTEGEGVVKNGNGTHLEGIDTGIDMARLRPGEKKTIDFRNKLYLAPLTTVGNLPFRRVCKGLGADITCSEMATCTSLLQGVQSEWALLKRHPCEDIFGIQLCGSFPDQMARTGQLLSEQCSMDFIDINSGCPIDMFFKKGEGCGLMGSVGKYERIVAAMSGVLGPSTPLTVKMRTGIGESRSTAHLLMPRLRDAGAALATLHGRSREQRYTRLADWHYIGQCVKAADPMPVLGNGDILSYEDYEEHMAASGVAGCMIARGALIKPWLFTEIKERRHWDISSSERLDILRDFTNYGLEHWGSDRQGVANTRRFLLEWLSFLYRYIPVGILERVPQRINEKPVRYMGRDDLETMMASPNCADWIRISEMLLGKVESDFTFLPKHKANAYK